MSKIAISNKGLRLEAPEPGDIVTVRIKRRTVEHSSSSSIFPFDDLGDEAENAQHYRMTGIWSVIAVNGGQAVVESLDGYAKGRREVWPIALHEWFEASELYEAMSAEVR